MKAIARSQRVLRAPGSGREWTRDRPPGVPDAFGLLPLLSLFDTVNALSICTPAKNSEIFTLPPDPDSTRPTPDEETRTMVGALRVLE